MASLKSAPSVLLGVVLLAAVVLKSHAADVSAACPNPPLVNVSLEAYAGVWYEIGSTALFKKLQEQDLICISARYSVIPDGSLEGDVRVFNSGYNISSGQDSGIVGYATATAPGRLAVYFPYVPEPGDYRIIYLHGDAESKYEVALVYSCVVFDGFLDQGLFILSRTPLLLPPVTVDTLLDFVSESGISLEPDNQLILTPQGPKTCGRNF